MARRELRQSIARTLREREIIKRSPFLLQLIMHTITVSPFLRACGSVSTRLRPAALATTAAGFSASPDKASGLATCCRRTSTNLFTSTTRFASSSSSGFVYGLRNSVRLPPCEFYGSRLYNNRSFVVAAGLARQTGRRIIVRDFPGFGRQQQPGGVRVLASAASGLLQGGSRMASSHGKRIVPRGPCASCRTECFLDRISTFNKVQPILILQMDR